MYEIEYHWIGGVSSTHLVLVNLDDGGAPGKFVVVEEWRRQKSGQVVVALDEGDLPDADVPSTARPAHRPAQRAAQHLVAEADAEDALPHGVERPQQRAEAPDPGLVAVRVPRAPAHHEPVVRRQVLRRRELAADHAEAVPPLPASAVAAEGGHEDVVVPAVRLPGVVRVPQRQQQRVPPRRWLRRRHRRSGERAHGDWSGEAGTRERHCDSHLALLASSMDGSIAMRRRRIPAPPLYLWSRWVGVRVAP